MTEHCFPSTVELGELSLDEVLLDHDGPRLLSCGNRTTGVKYLAVWIGEVDRLDSWLLAPTPDDAIEKVRTGRIPVRKPFIDSAWGQVYKLSISRDSTAVVERIRASALAEELLPAEGELLLAEFSRIR